MKKNGIVLAGAAVIIFFFGCGCSLIKGLDLKGGLSGDVLTAGKKAYEAGDYARAEREFGRALTRAKAEDGEGYEVERALYWLAAVYEAEGRSYDAERTLDEAVAAGDLARTRGKGDVEAMLDRPGEVYLERGRYGDAERSLKRSLAVKLERYGEDSVEVAATWNDLGVLYTRQGLYDRAERALLSSLAIKEKKPGRDDPVTAITLANLGSMYTASGNTKKALPLLEEALSIRRDKLGEKDPRTLSSLDGLGRYYTASKDYDRAEDYFKQVLAADGDYWQSHRHWGDLEVKRAEDALAAGDQAAGYDHLRNAIEHYHAAAQAHPTAENLCELGAAVCKAAEVPGAEEHKDELLGAAESSFELALDHDPGNSRALFELALLRWKEGKGKEAVELLDRAIASSPGNGQLYYFQGYFLEEQKQYAQALNSYQECLAVSPGEEMCRAARANLLKSQGIEMCAEPR